MYKPRRCSQPASAFHYPAFRGKGELKGLFRKPGRQKADYTSSEPQLFRRAASPFFVFCFVFFVSRPRGSLSLCPAAVISGPYLQSDGDGTEAN